MTVVHEALTIPLYTVAEAARMLRVPSQTLAGWARGYDYRLRSGELRHSEPLVTDYGRAPRHTPTMPFVGLAEASFLAAVREAGVPMQRIRPALAEIKLRMGIDHALASRALLTDGDEILIDLSRSGEVDVAPLMQVEVVRNRQGVLGPVMEQFARHITYGPSGYAGAISLPQFGSVLVAVDPEIAFGRPHLATSGVEVDAVMDRFSAGDAIPALADDFQLTDREIEELLRAELRPIGG